MTLSFVKRKLKISCISQRYHLQWYELYKTLTQSGIYLPFNKIVNITPIAYVYSTLLSVLLSTPRVIIQKPAYQYPCINTASITQCFRSLSNSRNDAWLHRIKHPLMLILIFRHQSNYFQTRLLICWTIITLIIVIIKAFVYGL
jgi:hypothetical protein